MTDRTAFLAVPFVCRIDVKFLLHDGYGNSKLNSRNNDMDITGYYR
jgi:hypothetical protein